MSSRESFRNNQPETTDTLPARGVSQLLPAEVSVLFGERFYLSKYPDVADGELAPLDHYLQFGGREERDPHPLFCTKYYLDQCPELRLSGENPLLHFISEGASSGKSPCPLFDVVWYVAHHKQRLEPDSNPLVHYLQEGVVCGCDPNPLFHTSFYLEQHPEVGNANMNPLVHYLLTGADCGFDPSPAFDTAFYKRHSPDVVWEGVNPLWHYFHFGQHEGRLPRNALLDAIAVSLANHYERLREIEPLLPPLKELATFPQRRPPRVRPAGRAYLKLADFLDRPFSRLIVVGQVASHPSQSLNVVPDLCSQYGASNLLVIAEDANALHAQAASMPEELRIITFEELAERLTLMDQILVLLRLILQTAPEEVYNLGSIACAILFRHYALQLKKYTRLANGSAPGVPQATKAHRSQATTTRQRACLSPGARAPRDPERSQAGSARRSGPKAIEGGRVDISVITPCHAEGDLIIPTIHSIAMAIEHARKTVGLTVEWLLILDNADEPTRIVIEAHAPSYARIIETEAGDPGLARNAGVLSSNGAFIALVDADDLISTNWLSAAHRFSVSNPDRWLVLHPMGEIRFGADILIRTAYDSDDDDFCRAGLVSDSFWVAGFARREIFLEYPYVACDFDHGFGFEDIQFNCDTIAANIAHKLVPDTFYCYRVTPRARSSDWTLLSRDWIPGPNELFAVAFQRDPAFLPALRFH